jgi:hypothetical protein
MQTDGLSAMPHNNANTLAAISLMTLVVVQNYYVRNNVHVERLFLQFRGYSGERRKSIVGASEWQFSDGLYAEMLL